MILIKPNINNVVLYNQFKTYIDKYITYSQNEEFIRNYSYSHVSVLKLYCAFNLINKVYESSLLKDIDNNDLYTISDLFSKYRIFEVAAELQKINININDILSIFFNISVTTDLLSFANKYNALSKLDKLIPNIVVNNNADNNTIVDVVNIYKNTTQSLNILVGYSNQPRPVIQNEWKSFTLSIRKNGTDYIYYWWNITNTPVLNQYPATISNIAGQIIFTLNPTILALLDIGLYDLRLSFIENDNESDVFEQIGVLNILL